MNTIRLLHLVLVGFTFSILVACGDGSPTDSGVDPGPGPDPGPPETDTLAPSLESVGFTPTRVTVIAEGELVFIAARVKDAESGVESVTAQFRSPQGAPISAFTELVLNSGSAQNGRYEGSFLVPRGGPGGVWTFLFVKATDKAGNSRIWNTDDLEELGTRVKLEVNAGG